MPAVSVLMNCFNGAEFLSEAIESVYAQGFGDWEIVFWDNQSTDDSARIAQSYDGRVRYFYAPSHTSLGAARNLALEKACGEYIAFLDCDDVWLPEKLERQIALFERDPQLILVYSDSYFVDGNGVITGTLFKKRRPFAGQVYPQLLCNDFIPLLTAVVRREPISQSGGFCSDFHHAEDWDLFLRLSLLGPFDFVPGCLAKYRIHANSFHLRNWVLMTCEEIDLLERNTPSIRSLAAEERKQVRRKMLSLHAKLATKRFVKEGALSSARGVRTSVSRYLDFARQTESR